MSIRQIQEAVKGVIQYYSENPGKQPRRKRTGHWVDRSRRAPQAAGYGPIATENQALSEDKPATATVKEGLRCRATGGPGFELVSDMPKGIGGGATAPTPGWFFRAALANCDATMIALRAAELGITLTTLEVTVSSTSDSRGLVQLDDSIHAGPLNVRVHVKLGGEGVSKEQLHQLVEWAERHSPIGDAISRAVPLKVSVEVV